MKIKILFINNLQVMAEDRSKKLREQLFETVLKKRACNAKAQQIVESLLETHIDSNDFMNKLNSISPDHYDDIINERHVLKLCGYPLCDNVLEKIPNQTYCICTARNKVYDLTERKKYCSGQCFKASQFIKAQIPETPLWLRDQNVQYNFKFLDINKNKT